jgi:hypothetical protein
MNARTLVRAVAGALSVAAIAPLAAQSPTVDIRPVVTFHVATRNHDRTMPATVVVADSAGQLVARYRLAKDSSEHRMGVFVYRDDLVVVGETEKGVLEMVFDKQAQGTPGRTITGRWSRGSEEGLLRGRVKG